MEGGKVAMMGTLAVGVVGGLLLGRQMASSMELPTDMPNAAEEPYQVPENNVIDGKAVAQSIREDLTDVVTKMKAKHGIVPGLAVVIVGERKDSQAYVRMKKRAANNIGFHSVDVTLPDTITQEELIGEVEKLNNDPQVHGILVQLPLPKHIEAHKVLEAISVEKDADGFHALNVGNMWISGGDPPLAVACTPAGCIELLKRYNVQVSGKDCVVLGRSNIVGMPMAALLQHMNGTVTICHSRTADLAGKVRQADIIIAAVGKPEMVRGDWVKPGAVVIDVGIHQISDGKDGKRKFCGDVAFDEVAPKCSLITPVPGGVGPMTIAMLCKNTVNLACHAAGTTVEEVMA